MKPQASIDHALKFYDKNTSWAYRLNLKRDVFEKICSIARLGAGDIFHLYQAIRYIPPGGLYLEIGSAEGGSIVLADEARHVGVGVIAISLLDRTTRDEFFKNTENIGFKFIENHSKKAFCEIRDESVDVLFMDGGKQYENVLSDLNLYWPKVKRGGCLIAHDFDWDAAVKESPWGTMRAITEFFLVEELTRLTYSTFVRVVKQ